MIYLPRDSKKKVETSNISPVSRARAYGVTKRESVFTRLNEHLADVLFVVLFALYISVAVVGAMGMVYMLQEIGIVICIIAALVFVYLVPLRALRKRFFFLLKLKKLCKRNKIRLRQSRSFWRGLKNNDTGIDLTVETGTAVWLVRFFAVRKYDSAMVFSDGDSVQITSPRPKGNVPSAVRSSASRVRMVKRDSSALGFRRIKTTVFPISFEDGAESVNGKTLKRSLIVNPVPHSIYVKLPDGNFVPTGNGEKLKNYTVFTASGFAEMLQRESASPTRPTAH